MVSLRLALVQVNTVVGDLVGNRELLVDAYQRAVATGAELVVTPELSLTGYPPEDLLLKEGFVANVVDELHELARQVGSVPLVVGVPLPESPDVPLAPPGDVRRFFAGRAERRAGALANAAAVLVDGSIHAVATKRLLPNYDVFDERRYFQPGVGPTTVVSVGAARCALVVCEDAWSSDGPLATCGPVSCVISLNASPYARGRRAEREAMAGARARQCDAPFVYVNAVGGQDELVFDGQSFATNRSGDVIARAGAFVSETLFVDLDGGASSIAQPLSDHAEVYGALVLGTRDYLHKNGFREAVLGLSGGVDSSLVATIAVDALGASAVRGFAMPSRYSSTHAMDDAVELARRLGVSIATIPIESMHRDFSDVLGSLEDVDVVGLTDENLQSRIRGVLLMAVSNATGAVVLTTGNKSEMAVGYSTLYGDSAGGYAVIKDLFKTHVYELCRWRNEDAVANGLTPPIPDGVLTKAPSAELRPDQRDDDSLPPYDVLDAILALYVEGDATAFDVIAAGFDDDVVTRVTRLVDVAEYKRRQSPPGVRVTTKAFGKDRRMPITNAYRGNPS